MLLGEWKHRQAFWNVALGPGCNFWRRFFVELDKTIESVIRVAEIFGVEDTSQVLSDLFSHLDLWNVLHRILHQVKLATLPRHARHDRFACRLEAFVGVADDKLHSMHATFFQRTEELTPVHLGL